MGGVRATAAQGRVVLVGGTAYYLFFLAYHLVEGKSRRGSFGLWDFPGEGNNGPSSLYYAFRVSLVPYVLRLSKSFLESFNSVYILIGVQRE